MNHICAFVIDEAGWNKLGNTLSKKTIYFSPVKQFSAGMDQPGDHQNTCSNVNGKSHLVFVWGCYVGIALSPDVFIEGIENTFPGKRGLIHK